MAQKPPERKLRCAILAKESCEDASQGGKMGATSQTIFQPGADRVMIPNRLEEQRSAVPRKTDSHCADCAALVNTSPQSAKPQTRVPMRMTKRFRERLDALTA